jgi:putative endonuclease
MFAGRYYCYVLVYYEHFKYIDKALLREKELKGWSRKKKMALIAEENPLMNELNASIMSPWPPVNGLIRGE